MKKIALLFVSLLILARSPSQAHFGPPFIDVNGQKTSTNQVFSGSIFFKVPNEIAVQKFLVGDTVSMSIDTAVSPFEQSQAEQATFTWDFGDGTQKTGLSAKHSYSKAGSFIVSLKIKDSTMTEAVEIETIQINVVPSANYTLPTAVIYVNGKEIKDPFKEPILVSDGDSVVFEAKGEGIRSYKWDFGDGSEMVTGSRVEHKFEFNTGFAFSYFPILRVEDENGLIYDTLVQITSNKSLVNPEQQSQTQSNGGFLDLGILGIGGIAILIVGTIIIFLLKFREKK